MSARRTLGAILSGLAALGYPGCHSSPAAPSTAVPSTIPPPPAASPTPAPTPSPSPNPLPVGSFRVVPPPGPGHIIAIPVGSEVKVNGSRFSGPEGVTLILFADWGDGFRGRIYCGPCRLQHAYDRPGTFHLVATIVDPSGGVKRSWTVEVSP